MSESDNAEVRYGGKWRAARKAHLAEHRECVTCGDPANVVDHVIPIETDPSLQWEPSNWQSLCTTCHNRKTAKQDGGFGNRKRGRSRRPAEPDNANALTITGPARAPLPVGQAGERRPGESAKAFHAFSHYRDLPVSSRSIDAAWAEHARECLGRQGGERRATGAFSRLSAQNDWPARAADHDDDLSRRRRARRATELERAEDDIAAVARSQLARVAERLRDMESDELSTNVLHSWLKAASEILLRVLGGDDKRVVEVQGEVDLLVYIRERAAAEGIDPDAAVAEAERMLAGVMDSATDDAEDRAPKPH